jgi:hypothetical protein
MQHQVNCPPAGFSVSSGVSSVTWSDSRRHLSAGPSAPSHLGSDVCSTKSPCPPAGSPSPEGQRPSLVSRGEVINAATKSL